MTTTKIPPEFLEALTGSEISDGSIGAADIADGAITTAKLAANAINATKLPDNVITATHIPDGLITGSHIANDTVTATQMADNSIGTDQLAGIARGKIIYGDSNGDPQLLAIGSSGTVLTSDGTDISWASGGVDGISSSADATAITIDSSENSTFAGNVTSPRFILNGTDSATTRYIFTDNTNTGDGRLVIQSGGGSAGYGGAINLYSHSHASKPGDVVAGISSGAGGAFRVNTSGIDSGSDVFVAKADGKVGIGTASPSRDFTFVSEGSTNGFEIKSDDERIHLMAAGGSSGSAADDGYYAQYSGGTGKTQLWANGTNFLNGGDVGINTDSPSAKLHVKSSGASTEKAFHISDSNGNDTFSVQGGGRVTVRYYPLVIGNDTGHSVTSGARLFIDGTTYDTIFDSVGRLLIGTTSVYSDSNDAMVVSGGRSNFTASGISSGAFNRQTNTGEIITLLYNGSGKGSISTNGSNIAFNTSSDARLKNILGESKGLDIISQLKPVNFEWKQSGKIQDGLIAQEVEPLIPEAVNINEQSGYYEMDYSKIVTPLVKAIQELEARIKELEK